MQLPLLEQRVDVVSHGEEVGTLVHSQVGTLSWCLKITEKVSFNIASEASYAYILSGQKVN